MLKKIREVLDRKRTTKIERLFINIKSKTEAIDPELNYTVLRSYTSRSKINGLEVSYFKLGNHLRGLFEYYDYYYEGLAVFPSEFPHNSDENFDREKFYVDLAKSKYDEICNRLSKELATLPDYKGKCYRSSTLLDIDVYQHKIKPDDFVMDNSYLSTSRFKGSGGLASWGYKGIEEAQGYFLISSKSGKYINNVSDAKVEHEILFDKQTVFKISKIVTYSESTFYIHMEEVIVDKTKVEIKNIYSGDLIN